MDKDEHFKILEQLSSFNFENYFTETEWVEQCALSAVAKKEEKESNEDVSISLENIGNKINKEEINMMKNYGYNYFN